MFKRYVLAIFISVFILNANNLAHNPESKQHTRLKSAMLLPMQPINDNDIYNFVSIISHSGGVLTIDSVNPGFNISTKRFTDYKDYGNAFNWSIQTTNQGLVRFYNRLSKTCLSIIDGRLAHKVCDNNSNFQVFKITPSNNGKYIISSANNQLCVSSSFFSNPNSSVDLNKCAKKAKEQQWAIMSPFMPANPLAVIKTTT